MWWLLRRRFEKTYEHVEGIKQHDPDEMISIPNDVELKTELSMPIYFFSDNGKIQVESKDDMRARGVRSPNKADAVCMCFAPVIMKQAGTFGRVQFGSNRLTSAVTHPGTAGKKVGTFGRNRLQMSIGATR